MQKAPYPLLVLAEVPHLVRICDECPARKILQCGYAKCEHFSGKERYWDSLISRECPESRFDVFKVSE